MFGNVHYTGKYIKCFFESDRVGVRIQKKGKLDTSHRYNLLPLLRSNPGGIQRELVVYDLPKHKGNHFFVVANTKSKKNCILQHLLPWKCRNDYLFTGNLSSNCQMLSNIKGRISSTFSNFHIFSEPTSIICIGLPDFAWYCAIT